MINVDEIQTGMSMRYEFMCIIKYLEYVRAQQGMDNFQSTDRSTMVYKIKTCKAVKQMVEGVERLIGFMEENRMKL